MNTILVTGANGFVGKILVEQLSKTPNYVIKSVTRKEPNISIDNIIPYTISDIDRNTDWSNILPGCDTIIHTAARVHIMNDNAINPLVEFRRVNVEGTLALARQAIDAGIRRFIYISTIKVNGETSSPNKPFHALDPVNPCDPYAISKYEAEQGLLELANNLNMEVVIIRPPLIYGPDVKGNFRSLINWLNKGWPMPLGAIHNKRSFVSVFNLVDLIETCITHPNAKNKIFLVSDGQDLSTTLLLKKLIKALQSSTILISVPAKLLILGATLLRKKGAFQRLCGSLQVDISQTCELLDWQPPIKIDAALKKTVEYF